MGNCTGHYIGYCIGHYIGYCIGHCIGKMWDVSILPVDVTIDPETNLNHRKISSIL
jgi:hypothetical protein